MDRMTTVGEITPNMYGTVHVTILDRGVAISGPLRRADFGASETRGVLAQLCGIAPAMTLRIGRHEVEDMPLDHPVIIKGP